MRKIDQDKEILKLIDAQIKFADIVFRDFRGKRFGMSTCSPETLNKAIMDQYLCSWEYNKSQFSQNPATTYSSTTWRRRMDPLVPWLTYAEFDPFVLGENVITANANNPCRGNCLGEENCSKYPTHYQATIAVIIDGSLVGTEYLPNESGQAILYAQVPGQPTGADYVMWRCAGEVNLNNLDPNGNLQLSVQGDDPFTPAVDGVLAGESIRFVLRDGCKIYQIVFDTTEWEWDSNGYNPAPPENDPFWDCSLTSFTNAAFEIELACLTYNIIKKPLVRVLCNACFGGPDADCHWCGMEMVQLPDSHEYEMQCIDDVECIHIYVTNQCGTPIPDYDIYIDNVFVGQTDEQGYQGHIISQAGVNWNHMLNFCYCFTTTGMCNQQRIDMVVHQEGIDCEPCEPVQLCSNAIQPLPEPIIIPDVILDPVNPDGPTTHTILCFTCDEENPAYSVGSYLSVPVDITSCGQVAPIGYWVNSPATCEPFIVGCTDNTASNYNPNATVSCNGMNGNVQGNVSVIIPCQQNGPNCCCQYETTEEVCDCLDPLAGNYNALATADCDCQPIGTFTGTGATNCCNYVEEEDSQDCFWINTGEMLRSKKISEEYDLYFGQGNKWFFLPIRLPLEFGTKAAAMTLSNSTCGDFPLNPVNNTGIIGGYTKQWIDIRIQFDKTVVFPGTQVGTQGADQSLVNDYNVTAIANNWAFQNNPWTDGQTLTQPQTNPNLSEYFTTAIYENNYGYSCDGAPFTWPTVADQETYQNLADTVDVYGVYSLNCGMGLDNMNIVNTDPPIAGTVGTVWTGSVRHYQCTVNEPGAQDLETIRLRFRHRYPPQTGGFPWNTPEECVVAYIPFRFINPPQAGTYQQVEFKFGPTCPNTSGTESLVPNELDSYYWTTNGVDNPMVPGQYMGGCNQNWGNCWNAFENAGYMNAFTGNYDQGTEITPKVCAGINCGHGYNFNTGEITESATVTVQIVN